MSLFARGGLAVAAAALGLVAGFFIGQWWSPVCHEGCPGPMQAAMWLFLLALPIVMAAVVFVATGRPRPLVRVAAALGAFALLGIVLTVIAAWLQGHARGV